MRIFLWGASGSTARATVQLFARQGYTIRPAAPSSTARAQERTRRLEVLVAPVRRSERWLATMRTCDAVIFIPPHHLYEGEIGRIYASFANLLAPLSNGATRPPRIVLQSALGAHATAQHAHLRAIWQAEEALRASRLEHVILRSGPVWDPETGPGAALVRFVRLWGRLPIMGDPDRLVQPIALANLAEGLVKSVRIPYGAGTTFDVAGPNIFRVRDWARLVAKALGIPTAKDWYIGDHPLLARALSQARALLPPWLIDRTCNPESYFRTLCIRPQRVLTDQGSQAPAISRPHSESTLN